MHELCFWLHLCFLRCMPVVTLWIILCSVVVAVSQVLSLSTLLRFALSAVRAGPTLGLEQVWWWRQGSLRLTKTRASWHGIRSPWIPPLKSSRSTNTRNWCTRSSQWQQSSTTLSWIGRRSREDTTWGHQWVLLYDLQQTLHSLDSYSLLGSCCSPVSMGSQLHLSIGICMSHVYCTRCIL